MVIIFLDEEEGVVPSFHTSLLLVLYNIPSSLRKNVIVQSRSLSTTDCQMFNPLTQND
jgi:hypothetical protein